MKNTSYTITAKLNVPEQGADGVIITQGGRFAGWGLVVLDGKPVWAYKNTQQPNDGIRISGSDKLTPGDHIVTVDFAVVFEDGRAAILADVERFVDRVDEGHRVADGCLGDFGAVHLEHVGAAFAELTLLSVIGGSRRKTPGRRGCRCWAWRPA